MAENNDMLMYIDGSWVPSGSGATIEKTNPSTGKPVRRFQAGTKDDVGRAIDAANGSWPSWYALGSVARSKVIYKARELMEKNRAELERILMEENGKISSEARGEVDGTLDQLQYYAEFARKLTGDLVEGDGSERKILQYRVPHGVVVAITPWNFPCGMVARKLGPALLTGNSVVLKPSSDTPTSAEWIVKMFIEAGIPRGVLNLVTGKGGEVGDYMVSHRSVGLITMTGSTSTGQRIMVKASSNMARLILELGGKAPFIVWKDADIASALSAMMWAKYWNTGQSCIAAERLYVHEDVYNDFMGRFVDMSKKLRVGSPADAEMGPLINAAAVDSMQKVVANAVGAGAKLLAGGAKPGLGGDLAGGYFYSPTIIEGAEQKSELFQEEVFGPVIGSMKVSDMDETIRMSNDSKYGLASYLFTKDHRFIFKAAERIRFGELYVNMPGPESTQGYHTGFRLTGQAGEGSKHGIAEYLKLKNVYIDYSQPA